MKNQNCANSKKFFKKGLQKQNLCGIMYRSRRNPSNRGIAQPVEYRSPKPWVVGSNPSAPAKKKGMAFAVSFFLHAPECRETMCGTQFRAWRCLRFCMQNDGFSRQANSRRASRGMVQNPSAPANKKRTFVYRQRCVF